MFPANCERCNMHVKCCICSFYVKEGWTKSSSGFPKVTPNITTDWTSKYGGVKDSSKSYKLFKETYVHDIFTFIKEDSFLSKQDALNLYKKMNLHTISQLFLKSKIRHQL